MRADFFAPVRIIIALIKLCFLKILMRSRDLLSRHVKLAKELGEHGPLSPNASYQRRKSGDNPEISMLNFESTEEIRTDAGPQTGSTLSAGDAQTPPSEASNFVSTTLTNELDMLWDSFQLQHNPFELSFYSPEFPMNFQSFDFSPSLGIPSLPETATPDSEASSRTEECIWQDDLPCASAMLRQGPLKDSTIHSQPRPPNTSTGISSNEQFMQSLARNPCYMSREAYDKISASVRDVAAILPLGFQFPSKHTFSRYIEGYSSFNLHRPFLHLSTRRLSQMPLELVFAIGAMGAQYRFEAESALALYYAAKSIIDARLNKAPAAVMEAAHNSTLQARPALKGVPNITVNPESTDQPLVGIETIQAMIICTSLCSWEFKNLLPDAFSLAEQVVLHLRQGGYLNQEDPSGDETWAQWIQREGCRRTVCIAFILFNLHTVFYETPPRLMAREVWPMKMPQQEAYWWAATELEWEEIRRRDPPISNTFGDYYLDLFVPSECRNPSHRTSAFGSLISVHVLVQQIQLTRETLLHIDTNCADIDRIPLSEDVYMKFRRALCRWDSSWSLSRESTTQPIAHMAPLGFNATAVFRIAWIRLSFNMGICRSFSTRDPAKIAAAFARLPTPERSPRLYSAVLQSAHALSIPVRIGIRYASKTQILSWSIVHSIANLECALFLSKWLEQASLESQSLHAEEKVLIRIIARILKETPFFEPRLDDYCSAVVIKQMAYSVLRLFTEMFKESHLYDVIGACIEAANRYASTLECYNEV
jgi:hypothetical protein